MQTSYALNQTAGSPGLLADTGFADKVSLVAEGAVGFGKAVARGTNPERQGKVATTGASVIGIAVKTFAAEQPSGGGNAVYADKESVSVLRRGRIWVSTNDAVVAGAAANLHTASGNFTDAAVAAGIEALGGVSGVFVTGTTGAGLAILEVNPK